MASLQQHHILSTASTQAVEAGLNHRMQVLTLLWIPATAHLRLWPQPMDGNLSSVYDLLSGVVT